MGDANKTKLRYALEPYYAADIGGAYATGVLTITGTIATNDTVTVGSKTYTFKTALSAANDVLKGSTPAQNAQNLADAINANQATVGVAFHPATTRNADAVAVASSNLVNLTARVHGTAGNSVATTETSANANFGGATLSGGAATNYSNATALRFNSATLRHNKVTVMSDEIRPDRTVYDLVKVGIGASGDINCELIWGDLNPFIISALQGGSLTSGSSTATDWSMAAGGVLTKGASFPANLSGAKYVKISGFATAALNGIKRVTAYSGNTLTIDGVTATEAAGASVTIAWAYVRQSITLDSYVIEEEIPDGASVIAITGCCVNTMAITLEPRSKAMIGFGFLGYGGVSRGDSVGNAIIAATENPVLNTTANIAKLLENGLPAPAQVRRLSLNLNNNLRERLALAREGTLTPGSGTAEITGNLDAYFTDRAFYESFLNHDALSLEFTMTDSSGRVMNFYMPKIRFGEGSPSIEGLNTDVIMPMTFQAVRGTGLDGSLFQLQVDMLS